MTETKKTEETPKTKKPTTDKGAPKALPKDESGGRKEGLEPTRYNDWEQKGRCIDF